MKALERLKTQFADEVQDGPVGIKSAALAGPTIDREQRLVKGMITTTEPDMDDEVVLPNFDTSYFPDRVKSVYLDHQYAIDGKVAAVGVCRTFSPRKSGVFAISFVRKGVLGDEILDAIECGALAGQSIGFRVLDASPPDVHEMREYGPTVKSVVRRAKLLEFSYTSMPANPGSLLQLESMVKSGQLRRKSAVLMGLPDSPERKSHRARPLRSLEIRNGVAVVRAS